MPVSSPAPNATRNTRYRLRGTRDSRSTSAKPRGSSRWWRSRPPVRRGRATDDLGHRFVSLSRMKLVAAVVAEATMLGPRFHRVVLHVASLDALTLPTAPDTSIGIYFDVAPAKGRTYTVRECDPASRLLSVDVVLHGDAPGTWWARRAAPGDVVTIGHPGSWYTPRVASESQLLAADLAGLPALARVLESVPPDSGATVIV